MIEWPCNEWLDNRNDFFALIFLFVQLNYKHTQMNYKPKFKKDKHNLTLKKNVWHEAIFYFCIRRLKTSIFVFGELFQYSTFLSSSIALFLQPNNRLGLLFLHKMAFFCFWISFFSLS